MVQKKVSSMRGNARGRTDPKAVLKWHLEDDVILVGGRGRYLHESALVVRVASL